ncbi:MAG: CPBP family intramembrane metalloprotease [Planctomycetota bacterium]|nr:CPBP family intramembrane metalloprotease [Planctomycetota bacterium]
MDEEQTVIPDPLSRNQIMQMAMVVEGLLIPGAILIGWWGGFDPLDKLALTRVDLIWGVAGGLGLALLVVAVLALPLQPVRAFRELMDGQVNPMLAASTYPDRLGIALLAGFCEEMLFRGAIQTLLGQTLIGPWGGIVIASVLFGALHSLSLIYFVAATLIGCLLGWLYEHTGNLLGPMVLHGLYDLVILLLLVPYQPVEDSEEDAPDDDSWG